MIRFPSPAYTWAQVKALGGGGGAQVPRASFLSSLLLRRSGPVEMGGGAYRAGRPPPPPPRFLRLCCRCARAPRLPHCGSRGPINRESDVLRSREWRGPGSWGRGRAEPQAPVSPPPGHVSWAPGSHPPHHVPRVSAPWGHVKRVLRPRLLGVTWEGTGGTRAVASLTDLGAVPCTATVILPLSRTQSLRLVLWNRGNLFPVWPRNRAWGNLTGRKHESVRSRGPMSPELNGGGRDRPVAKWKRPGLCFISLQNCPRVLAFAPISKSVRISFSSCLPTCLFIS